MPSRKQILLEAINILASDPAAQIERLKLLGNLEADELFLEYEAIGAARANMFCLGEVDRREYDAIDSFHLWLMQVWGTDNTMLWSRESLTTAPDWVRIRERARVVLHALAASDPTLPDNHDPAFRAGRPTIT